MKSKIEEMDRRVAKIFAAATFAEANDHDTAREIIDSPPAGKRKTGIFEKLGRIMSAITFAESNCPDIAREMLDAPSSPKSAPAPARSKSIGFAETVGLKGVPLWYGVVEVRRAG